MNAQVWLHDGLKKMRSPGLLDGCVETIDLHNIEHSCMACP